VETPALVHVWGVALNLSQEIANPSAKRLVVFMENVSIRFFHPALDFFEYSPIHVKVLPSESPTVPLGFSCYNMNINNMLQTSFDK
jgi:hypothetical protein